ncbi:TPA: hypothetical protein MAD82_001790 [Klebsiella pneumoniae]|uniref:Uncharacterized protein n=1 Tax=Klebsiella pneumoniae TaxID=573 RepID=A0A6B2IWJ1_KLEPN|nr:hypothetical protein [Klebsiella pneumoniae]EKX9394656.1 hypothetical protein [Klebsiella pneumoniae]NDR62725.1 hypothetical protein [Klebsiella pneumoniae]NDR83305.1 hypothetical protein [Klebsiella pneumoniae]NDR98955.1 hypothetical protein [Klebsiella pneumoniae]NDS05612.1 hypothetical protein [Klebsiella pneumoniae]
MRFALLLLWLTILAPAAHAADWLTWRRVGEGQFWYRASAAQTAFTPLGPRQSAAFSTRFLAIWLDPRTTYPELRQQLIGGTP